MSELLEREADQLVVLDWRRKDEGLELLLQPIDPEGAELKSWVQSADVGHPLRQCAWASLRLWQSYWATCRQDEEPHKRERRERYMKTTGKKWRKKMVDGFIVYEIVDFA